MLDLRSMSDEEFSVLVTPSVPQAAMYVRVEESGKILLSSKVAEKVAKTPVHIRFNKDYTAVQISKADMQEKSILFPKNGRKTVPDAAEILKRNHIPLPAVFRAISARNSTNGEVNGSKTLLQSPRQLPGVQGRNRTASI